MSPATVARTRPAPTPGRLIARPEWVPESLFPFAVRAVTIGEAELTFIDEGNGPVLLFTPGSPMWSFMFRSTVAALRDRFRCVVVDLPGLGLSRAPLQPGRAFSSNAGLYQGFIRALDLRDVTLLVHATAGPSALEMAIRERPRIEGLVVTNSFAWPLSEVPAFRRFVRVLRSAPFAFLNVRMGLLPRIASRFGRRTRPFSPEERAATFGPYRSMEARRHLQNLLVSLATEDAYFAGLRDRVGVLADLPALLLYGARDNGYKIGFMARWQQLLPRHKVVVLERADHFAPEDQPEDYTAAIAEWWDGVLAPAAGQRGVR